MEERIPVGTRVEIVGAVCEGKKGTVVKDDKSSIPYLVKLDDGNTIWKLARNLKPLVTVEQFKVGDKVRCVSDDYGDWRRAKENGWVGIIASKVGIGWRVNWESGEHSLQLQDTDLELVAEAAPAERKPKRGEIWRDADEGLVVMTGMFDEDGDPECFFLEGDDATTTESVTRSDLTFVADGLSALLAQSEAKAAVVKEEKREPKPGEIWRRGKDEFLLRPEQVSRLKWISLNRSNEPGYLWVIKPSNLTFAYPNLAAAIEAGEKFN